MKRRSVQRSCRASTVRAAKRSCASSASRARLQRHQVSEPEAGQAAGSVPTTVAERGLMRYTCHGGGPGWCVERRGDAGPLSSGSAGHPLSAHAFTIARRRPDRSPVRRPLDDDVRVAYRHADRAARNRATLRPSGCPTRLDQNAPSSQRAPTAVTCGLPSCSPSPARSYERCERLEPATIPPRASR